jgi:hypothetical protein
LVTDLTIAMLAILAGTTGMLWLLLVSFGDGHATPLRPYADDSIAITADRRASEDPDGPFIPMPDHLKTHHDMVAWMTRELPRLAAESASGPDTKPKA